MESFVAFLSSDLLLLCKSFQSLAAISSPKEVSI
jgi:hypothetical protein